VATPGGDTWKEYLADLVYSWTSTEVTRVTTERVTRGMVMSAVDVEDDWAVRQSRRGSTVDDSAV
jgi:hypothetical protein